MCGIVGGISERNILPILVEGLSEGLSTEAMILPASHLKKMAQFLSQKTSAE